MFITSFEEQNITYRSCSNLRIHLYPSLKNRLMHEAWPVNLFNADFMVFKLFRAFNLIMGVFVVFNLIMHLVDYIVFEVYAIRPWS
ncbi:hypothetical protein AhaeAN54_003735 [Acinetobacter haemolyticus]|nr:hypothetical protein AhaeAN54_003735 [Acinetobacter haemolyticus]